MRILVTGGGGFIGSHIVEELLKRGHEVVVVLENNPNLANLENVKKDIEFVKADITDFNKLSSVVSPNLDGVIHMAALINVDQSISAPEAFLKTNVIGTFNVAEVLRKKNIPKLLYMSSCEVYGNIPKGKADENHPTNPRSPYAASKFCAERYLLAYSYTYNAPKITIIRGFNQYGPRQKTGAGGAVIPIFITNLLNNKKIQIFGDGKQTRDYVYVTDTARGIADAFEKNLQNSEIVNLATGVETSIVDIANKTCNILGKNTKDIEFVKARAGELRRSCGDYTKATKLLGWKPKVNFDEGLKKTVEWFKNK